MTMFLDGKQGYMRLNIWNWSKILTLAQQYGWQPMGTEAPDWDSLGLDRRLYPDDPDWDGSYTANEGQWVKDRDARNIAAALERALADIPDHDVYQDKRVVDQGPTDTVSPFERFSNKICTALIRGQPAMEITIPRNDRDVDWNTVMAHNTLEWFSGQGKKKVQGFIAFCKKDGFSIW